jgi:hypothetical protein
MPKTVKERFNIDENWYLVRIVGSSIVRDGFIEAKMQPGGINLSLKKRLGVSIWWQGRGGLTLRKLKNHIRF